MIHQDVIDQLSALQKKVDALCKCCFSSGLPETDGIPSSPPATGTQNVRIDPATGIIYYWDSDSWEVFGGSFASNYVTVESAAATLTYGASGFYIATGTTATHSLPAVIPGNIGRVYFIKNRGSGALTIDVVGGSSTIYDMAAVASIIIPAGEARILSQDSAYWNVQ